MRYLIFGLLLCACSDTNFKQVEELRGFRILAAVTATPEVAPGGGATVRLYVSDPQGGGRQINETYEACIDPGVSLGATPSRDHDPNKESGPYGVDTTVADLANNLFTGESGSVTVTVPATIFAGRSAREQFNGISYLVLFKFTVDGKKHIAFKRIIATSRTAKNINPSTSSMFQNGIAPAGVIRKDDKFSITSDGPETYEYLNIDGNLEIKTEVYEVAWYVSMGEFNRPKASLSDTVEYEGDPSSSQYVILSIIRDDRGGVEVLREP